MNLLAIETSTEIATVALCVHGQLHQKTETTLKKHAQILLPMIDQLLKESGISMNELNGVVFGRGPGSFTGLRIACSVAKGLAYAQDLPLYPVSSLAAIAFEARSRSKDADHTILAAMDARMNQLYWTIHPTGAAAFEECVSDASDVIVPANQPIILAGVGFEPYCSQMPAATQSQLIKQQTVYPNAATMIKMVHSGFIASVTAHEAVPIYIRNQVTHGAPRG